MFGSGSEPYRKCIWQIYVETAGRTLDSPPEWKSPHGESRDTPQTE